MRPSTTYPIILHERREQDKVFGLLLTLSPMYTDLIKHILRSEKLLTLDEVCSQVQKELGSLGLFEGKESLSLANQAVTSLQSHKAQYKKEEGKRLRCEHCKRDGTYQGEVLGPSPTPQTCQVQMNHGHGGTRNQLRFLEL